MKKLGILAIEVVIITLFIASLWWVADKNKAYSQDQVWLVDWVPITAEHVLSVSAARTSNKLAVQFKKILARIYLAFAESQRRRAAAIIDRYQHLIPDYEENSNHENKIG